MPAKKITSETPVHASDDDRSGSDESDFSQLRDTDAEDDEVEVQVVENAVVAVKAAAPVAEPAAGPKHKRSVPVSSSSSSYKPPPARRRKKPAAPPSDSESEAPAGPKRRAEAADSKRSPKRTKLEEIMSGSAVIKTVPKEVMLQVLRGFFCVSWVREKEWITEEQYKEALKEFHCLEPPQEMTRNMLLWAKGDVPEECESHYAGLVREFKEVVAEIAPRELHPALEAASVADLEEALRRKRETV